MPGEGWQDKGKTLQLDYIINCSRYSIIFTLPGHCRGNGLRMNGRKETRSR